MPDNVPVWFRDCTCPGTPHPDGDVAELRPYLDYPGGVEALAAIQRALADTDRDVLADPSLDVEAHRLAKTAEYAVPVMIGRGVVAWNVVDEDGPVPVTRERLAALRWEDAYELGERADDIYGVQIFAPLGRRPLVSSANGPTGGSTPPRRRSSPKPRTPSRSSS
jgi:hypothetical protein